MISRNDYDSFGEIVSSTGLTQNAVTYTGQRLDVESGLMALGNGERYYNPSYGRFIQQDSYAGMPDMPQSLNRFSYTHNNPNKYTDPSGNAVVTTLLIGGAILAAFSVGTGTVKAKRQHELEAVEQRWEANDNRLNWGSAFADGTGATQAFKGFTGTDAYKGSDYAYTGKPWWHRPWDATVGSLEVVGNAFAVSGPATQGIKAFTTGGATLRSSFQSAQGWARNTEPFKQQWGAFTNVVLNPRQTGRAIADIARNSLTSLKSAASTLRTDGFKGTAQRALNFAGEELLPRLNPRNYKLSRNGWDINIRFSTIRLGSYRELNRLKRTGQIAEDLQSHHLNQNAAFRDVIPKEEGASIALRGNAFTEPGTPHFEFHRSLETFWDRFRRNGVEFGQRPTNRAYGQAVETASRDAGLRRRQARRVANYAREHRESYGLLQDDRVPRIPRTIGQRRGDNISNISNQRRFVVPPPAVFGLGGNEDD